MSILEQKANWLAELNSTHRELEIELIAAVEKERVTGQSELVGEGLDRAPATLKLYRSLICVKDSIIKTQNELWREIARRAA